jgi:hypothetical protein
MSSLLQPLHLLLMMFAGWVNRHQLDVIDYLREENRVLKERLGGTPHPLHRRRTSTARPKSVRARPQSIE